MSKYSDNLPPSLKGAIEWMLDDITPGSVFLDFGCSTGYFGEYLIKEKACEVYGVEISDDIRIARKKLKQVYRFDLDGIWPKEIFKRKYDYAFFGDVLEHLKYPEITLRYTKDLLKDDAKLFVSIPNIAHISNRLELLQGSFEYESMGLLDNTHLKYFTLESFTRLAYSEGFEVTKMDATVNQYPKKLVSRILKRVGLKPEKKFWEIADSIEARSFQYKFVMKKVSKELSPVPAKIIKPQKEKDLYIDSLEGSVRALKKHADEQAKIIENLTSNKSGKLLRKIKKIKP